VQVHLKTLGCRLNEAELETWARQFRQLGHGITADPGCADLLVINTCAVTGEAVRKSRQLIRRAQKNNPQAKLVVSGCYASLNPDAVDAIPGVDLLVDNRQKDRLPALVNEQLCDAIMPVIATEPGENPLFSRGRQRAFIKVQDGCRYRCTFCIVTRARGEERSRPVDDIIDEINALHAQGISEAVITGVHLGGYGSDLDVDLHDLVTAILERTGIPRLRLGSLEPWDIPDNFWELFDNPRLMPHLHLPLQSGSDTVLRRMARRCKTADFSALVASAREQVPQLNITTDIIVGFPGETAGEWQQTLDYLRDFDFGHIHIFAYSPRPDTKAAGLPNPVPEEIKKARSRELHALLDIMRQRQLDRQVGQTVPVLVEHFSDGRYWGYTPNYIRVGFEAGAQSEPLESRILDIGITAVADDQGVLVGKATSAPGSRTPHHPSEHAWRVSRNQSTQATSPGSAGAFISIRTEP
jgi:threonylcarbamoyladenosine tRNA methylthiotransferase MtaB